MFWISKDPRWEEGSGNPSCIGFDEDEKLLKSGSLESWHGVMEHLFARSQGLGNMEVFMEKDVGTMGKLCANRY